MLDDCPAHHFLKELPQKYEKPKAIIVISAHWELEDIKITSGAQHETIYDFAGFQPELYHKIYPAKGDPALARDMQRRIASVLPVELDSTRGLDHGAWVPLSLMYPAADIPVVQLSIHETESPEYHYRLGQAIKPLRDEGVMIIGSGSTTHNLPEMIRDYRADQPPDWVATFNEWLADKILTDDADALFQYKTHAYGLRNHPTADHISPLFTALGAGDGGTGTSRLHQSYTYGVLAMDIYAL